MSDTPKRRGRPPAKPAKPAVKRWEYATEDSESPIRQETFDTYGKWGWELVSIYVRFDTVHAVFKREVV